MQLWFFSSGSSLKQRGPYFPFARIHLPGVWDVFYGVWRGSKQVRPPSARRGNWGKKDEIAACIAPL